MQTKIRGPVRREKRVKAQTPAQIDRQRDSYIQMIALARKFDTHPSAMIDKAQRLLTRHWGKSNWASRAEILKTVDWLLQIAMAHAVPPKQTEPDSPAFPRSR